MNSAQFSPYGNRIVTTSENQVQVWDTATGQNLATLAHPSQVNSVQFSPDGNRIVTTSRDESARIWTILPPSAGAPPDWFVSFLRYLAQMRLNSEGELETLKLDDWLRLREQLRGVRRASTEQDTSYLRILRRYFPE
jgi:WD40 repeat protein